MLLLFFKPNWCFERITYFAESFLLFWIIFSLLIALLCRRASSYRVGARCWREPIAAQSFYSNQSTLPDRSLSQWRSLILAKYQFNLNDWKI